MNLNDLHARIDQLHARIAELEAENAILRQALQDVEEYDDHPGLSALDNANEVRSSSEACDIPEAK